MHLKKRIRFRDKNQNALDFTIKKNYYSISKGKSKKPLEYLQRKMQFYYIENLIVFSFAKFPSCILLRILILRGRRIVLNIPPQTAHDPCRRPSER